MQKVSGSNQFTLAYEDDLKSIENFNKFSNKMWLKLYTRYLGETESKLKKRIAEHHRSSSHVGDHLDVNHHILANPAVSVLHHESDWFKRGRGRSDPRGRTEPHPEQRQKKAHPPEYLSGTSHLVVWSTQTNWWSRDKSSLEAPVQLGWRRGSDILTISPTSSNLLAMCTA